MGFRFDLKSDLYGIPGKVTRANGWNSYCLDGDCMGKQILTPACCGSSPTTPASLAPMTDGVLGDGQSLRFSGAITKFFAGEQNQLNALTHFAEAEGRLYGIQTYAYSALSWAGASPHEYFPPRTFNEARATQIRSENSGLCTETVSNTTAATIVDPGYVPRNLVEQVTNHNFT
jgi:hypothetical protein